MRWPVEYLSAVLSAGFGYYPPRVYIEDARAFGATIGLPCVNRSGEGYEVEDGGILRVGLSAIKGLGPAGIEAILRARQEGPFAHLGDLRRRTGLARPELETLIMVGACDVFGLSRPGLLWQLVMLASTKAAPSVAAQGMLFALPEALPEPPEALAEYPPRRRQAIERERLGYTVTLTQLRPEVGCISFQEAKALPLKTKVSVVAEIVSRFGHRTKKGEKMSFLTLSDGAGQMQGVVFPEAYARFSRELRRGVALVFSGTVGDEDGEPILVVTHVGALGAREVG
ncbi:DNA polymerase III subunit alpha [compost metagenome]